MMSLLLVLQLLLGFFFAAFAYTARKPPIVGGGDANIEDYPYQVGLESINNFQFCGGSIVSEKFIVTAAHCVIGKDVRRMQVRVGADYAAEGGKIYPVATGTIHPNHTELIYDVAVLELESPLQFSQKVNKIALPDVGDVELEADMIVNITGYGDTEPRRKNQRLQAVQVPIVSREDCKKAYEDQEAVSEDMICAGVLGTGGKDSCQGDSGGPLAYKGKLYGIVSWGLGCADPDYPGVYSNVIHLLPFIKEVTGL